MLVAIIPTGLQEEKNFNDIGSVKSWAPLEEERLEAKYWGKKRLKKRKKNLFVNNIPNRAP